MEAFNAEVFASCLNLRYFTKRGKTIKLIYSLQALLRMDTNISNDEKKARVNVVIEEVGYYGSIAKYSVVTTSPSPSIQLSDY